MKTRLLGLIAVATLLKMLLVLNGIGEIRVFEDGIMAANLVRAGSMFYPHYGVQNHSWQFPLYPSLVAAIYWVCGIHPRLVPILNLTLNAFNAWIAAELFGRLFDRLELPQAVRDRKSLVLSASVIAFLAHPLISYYAMKNVHPFALDMLVLYATMLAAVRFLDLGCRRRDLVILGACLGLVLLTRTVLVVGVLPMTLAIAASEGLWPAARRTGAALAVGLLLSVPWLVRNYRVDGVLGYTSTTGEILWKGALGSSEGSNFLEDGRPYTAALTQEDARLLRSMTVKEQNRFFLRKFVTEAKACPACLLRLLLKKLRNFFWFRPGMGSEYAGLARGCVGLYEAAYGALLVLALIAAVRIGRSSILLWCVPLALGLFQSIFYVETRHRVIIEPLLMMLAGLAIADAAARCVERGRPVPAGTPISR